ncbi:MAG: hypothetical protein AAGA48_18595 [Myxococcota bacterium]
MTNLAVMAFVLLSGDALAGSEVSSFKKESRLGANYWNAASAMDGKPETCWQVDPEQKNVGSWIAIDTPAATIDKLGMMIGWEESDDVFKDYARVKTAKVEIFETGGGEPQLKGEGTVTFKDQRGWQVVELPDTKVGGELLSGGRVKITVTSVYPGKDYPNLAVSEVRVQLQEFEAGTLRLNSAPASGKGEYLVDGNRSRVWVSDDLSGTFSVQAPGYGLSSLDVIQAGKAYARPKSITIRANGAEVTHTLDDKPGIKQNVLLPYLMGYTGGSWGDIEIEVVDVYPGGQPKLAIAELALKAGSIEDI